MNNILNCHEIIKNNKNNFYDCFIQINQTNSNKKLRYVFNKMCKNRILLKTFIDILLLL